MVRKGQERRHGERRADRAREEAMGSEQGGYVPPPRSESVRRTFHAPLDDEATLWLTTHLWRHRGRLVEFALTVSAIASAGNDWGEIDLARVDVRHGHAHAHPQLADGSDGPALHILRLDSIDDVQPALAASVATLQQLARRLLRERG